jgi:hypothetical protein
MTERDKLVLTVGIVLGALMCAAGVLIGYTHF